MVSGRMMSISHGARLGAILLICLGWIPPARAQAEAGLNDFQAGRFSEAFQAWHDAADQGDAASALYLGVLYDTGTGVSQDYRQALAWYERGAANGNETAMFNAAIMYDAGRGTAPNPAAAVAWYDRAAQRGYGRAEYNLALLYEGGIGVAPDRGRAVRFYRAAASHGIAAARSHLIDLGSPYAGATPRLAEDPAMISFQKAQYLLLARGTAEAARAVELFRRAAESGNPLAAYNLAYCYEHGLGVAPSVEQAIAWYRRSAASAGDSPVKEIAEVGARNLLAGVSHAQR